jgi:hypothetical protein
VNNRLRRGFIVLLMVIPMMVSAFGNKEKDNVVQATGVVRLVGTALFSELVITGSDKEWYIEKDEMDKLHDLQYRTVTVEGVETLRDVEMGNGRLVITRRELKKIKIVSVN